MADKPLRVVPDAHPAGLCDASYLNIDGKVHLITCGPDGKLCYRCCRDHGQRQALERWAERLRHRRRRYSRKGSSASYADAGTTPAKWPKPWSTMRLAAPPP